MRPIELTLLVAPAWAPLPAQLPENLVPNPEVRAGSKRAPLSWEAWSPTPELRPAMDVMDEGGVKVLRVASRDFSSFGKWLVTGIAIQPGRYYQFEVQYRPEGLTDERGSVANLLSWNSATGEPLQRDYVDRIESADDGWCRASRTLRAPDKATSVTVELSPRWTKTGSVCFRNPRLMAVPAPAARRVRVVTTRVDEHRKTALSENLKFMAEILDRAGREQPDVVLLTEVFVDRGIPGPPQALAQPIPGPATAVLSEKARQYRTYIITTLLESEGGRTYNAAVVVDRQGQLVGKYRNTHLPLAEVEDDITPGSDYPVFDTDFGRIGIMICWDAFFPETARILRLKGAEILFWPLASDPGARHWDVKARARAVDNGVYVVTSVSQGLASRIIDPDGEVVVEATEGLATATLDLARESRLWWLSVGPADGEAKSLVIQERRADTYGVLVKAPR